MQFLQTALRNIRLFIAVVIGVPILLFAGVMMAVEWWSGSGTLHVVASPTETVSVSIDGAPPQMLAPGQHFRQDLAQGTHRVVTTGPMGQSSYDLAVTNGMWQALAPTSPQQCWVELNVYDFYYAPSRGLPTIENRYPATATVPVSSSAYYEDTSLPRSVTEHTSVTLMQPVPCAMLAAPDAQLISGLGFQL